MSLAVSASVESSISLDELVDASIALRSMLSRFDPRSLSGPECVRLTEELAATERTCGSVRLVTASRAVDSGAHLSLKFSDGASWLALQSGCTRHQAKRDLDTVDRLEDFPATQDAFLTGSISKDQATVVVEAATEKPGIERQLLNEAFHSDLSQLRETARKLLQEDTPPEDLHTRQQKARSFRHWRDQMGMVHISGRLTPEVGVPFLTRLEQGAAEAKRAARAAGVEHLEKWEAYAADAFAELCSPSDGGKRSARTELVIVCDLFAWRRGHTHPGEACHIIGGGPIPVDLAKSLCEDAFIKAALYEGTNIHTVKHFGRRYKAELRTALDLGPVPEFTGRQCAECGSRWGLEYDHIDPVANDGPTSYDNIQALCWSDHQAKTKRDREAGLLGGRYFSGGPPDD